MFFLVILHTCGGSFCRILCSRNVAPYRRRGGLISPDLHRLLQLLGHIRQPMKRLAIRTGHVFRMLGKYPQFLLSRDPWTTGGRMRIGLMHGADPFREMDETERERESETPLEVVRQRRSSGPSHERRGREVTGTSRLGDYPIKSLTFPQAKSRCGVEDVRGNRACVTRA